LGAVGGSFLRSSIKSIKEARVSAFDPSNKSLPKYVDKDEGARDINQVRHLLKGKDVKMTGVLWELSLRKDAYLPPPKEGGDLKKMVKIIQMEKALQEEGTSIYRYRRSVEQLF
jgi:hypothetical protein